MLAWHDEQKESAHTFKPEFDFAKFRTASDPKPSWQRPVFRWITWALTLSLYVLFLAGAGFAVQEFGHFAGW